MSLFIFEYQISKWVFCSFRLLQSPESHWPFIYLSVPLTWHFHSRARTKSFPFPNLGGFLQVKIGDQGGSFSLASVAELSWQAGRQVLPWLIIIKSKTRHCPSKDQFEITKKRQAASSGHTRCFKLRSRVYQEGKAAVQRASFWQVPDLNWRLLSDICI